jgi:phage tail-like protein
MRKHSVWLAAVALASAAIGVAGLEPSGAAPPAGSDATTVDRFSITVDGREIASFSDMAGIVTEVEPSQYRAATTASAQATKQVPGTVKPPTVTLKREANRSLELWAWHEAARQGTMAAARRNCSLVMFNPEGKPVVRYALEGAWPSKLELTGLKAGAVQALIETVTFTADSIQRVAP